MSKRKLNYTAYRSFGHGPFTAFVLGCPRTFLLIAGFIILCGALVGAKI